MTATNHAVTGALIGLLSGQPLVALPAAILSHFICDALPHYGSSMPSNRVLQSAAFRSQLLVDGGLCILLVVVLAIEQPEHWLLAAVCAFLATSPDLFWINRYLKVRHQQNWRPNLYSNFAAAIQWFERPIGMSFELAWLIAGVSLLTLFVA